MKKEELQQNMKDRMQQFEDGGLRLLKKGQKGIVHAIFSRFGLVLLLMLLQVGVLWSVFRWFGPMRCDRSGERLQRSHREASGFQPR